MITIKRRGKKVYVYENNSLMWVKNLVNPLKSYGVTDYSIFADNYTENLARRRKKRSGYILKENGFWVVYYRIKGIRNYRKEFIKKSQAVDFLWQK
jgi:hypothetical protein